MSKQDDEQQPNRRPNKNSSPNRKPKNDSNGKENESKGVGSSPFFMILLAALILALLLTALVPNEDKTEIVYSDFLNGVNSGEYNATNVHDLVISKNEIVFYDKPDAKKKDKKKEKKSSASDNDVTQNKADAPKADTPKADKEKSNHDAPVEDAPVEDAPVEDAPVEDAPVKESASEKSDSEKTKSKDDLKKDKASGSDKENNENKDDKKEGDAEDRKTDANADAPEPTIIAKAEKSDEKTSKKKSEKRKAFYIPIHSTPGEEITKLSDLLISKKISVEWVAEPSNFSQMLFLAALFILPLVFLYILFSRMSGTGSAMSFGRSRGKLFAQDDIHTTFKDVAGIDEACEELKEIVEFLRTPEKYQALGGRIPHGVLLVGPPGTGKTLLAKAVAGEAGVPFFGLSGSDFVEMYVGVGAARVRDMFQQAVQRAPAIIFIDELDALGRTRGSGMQGGHDEREQTLNALLVEMDGFSSEQSVIVMGATNRPETLDPALMRPGRFDRHVLVDKPDYKGREAILKVHSKKIKMDDSIDFNQIARMTSGFSGADLANLVNEAALLAARNNKKAVSSVEFEEGVERVVAGLEKSSKIITEDEKQRVAYHECGHALIACSLPHTDPVHKISIIPRGFGALGYMLQRPQEDRYLITKTELEHRVAVLLGGNATEQMIFNETSTGAQNDLERATDIARRMVTEFGMSPKLGRVNYQTSARSPFLGNSTGSSEHVHSEATMREIDLEVKRIIDESMDNVFEILSDRREVLEHMTRDLLEKEVMDAKHLQSILDQYKTGPQLKPGTSVENVTTTPSSSTTTPKTEGDSPSANGA